MKKIVLPIVCLIFIVFAAGQADAQDNCVETPLGRVCQVQQPITAGTTVSVDLQRRLGLVTVGGCSGTLLNRSWVLTARHCVTVDGQIPSRLLNPNQIQISAAWAPGVNIAPTRIYEFAINSRPGRPVSMDIILVYLGGRDFGIVNSQPLYLVDRQATPDRWVGRRLTTNDQVTQYGRGFSTFASGVLRGTPPAIPAQGIGTYRSAQFNPSNITSTGYDLQMNSATQVGHGGDSGGPSIVTVNGAGVGIAGVQSTCTATGYVPNSPIPRIWMWATGISLCSYVSVETLTQEIGRTIATSQVTECPTGDVCVLPAVIQFVLGR